MNVYDFLNDSNGLFLLGKPHGPTRNNIFLFGNEFSNFESLRLRYTADFRALVEVYFVETVPIINEPFSFFFNEFLIEYPSHFLLNSLQIMSNHL